MASFSRLAAATLLTAFWALPAHGQPPEETPAPVPEDRPAPAAPAPQPAPSAQPPLTPDAVNGEPGEPAGLKPAEDRILPRLDVFFPEGDLDLRISRLINEVFFEGQVKYNFINGDITAFLRYRYYGLRRTTQITVFDSISFDRI